VRAHVGVEGNEKADRAAVDAADGILPRNASMELVDTPEETGTSNLWLTTDGVSPAVDPVDTRNKWDREARRDAERANTHSDYCHMAEIKTVCHEPSNAFATAKSIPHRDKAWVWKARSNSIATRKRRKQWGMLGPTETATCTLCGKADDTVGHRLGWCQHEKMGGLYVKRHDHVVKTLAGSFLRGSKGGWSVEYNAGTREDGSTHAMIHERLVRRARPQNRTRAGRAAAETENKRAEETLALLRPKPDVIIYEGVRQEDLQTFLDNKEVPDKRIKIHILELGYCNDWKWEAKIAEKEKIYGKLVAQMKACGWKVEYKQVALGTQGSVYKHLETTLEWLGVKNYNTRKKTVKDIALHGAREASKTLRTYEWLTRTEKGGERRLYDG